MDPNVACALHETVIMAEMLQLMDLNADRPTTAPICSGLLKMLAWSKDPEWGCQADIGAHALTGQPLSCTFSTFLARSGPQYLMATWNIAIQIMKVLAGTCMLHERMGNLTGFVKTITDDKASDVDQPAAQLGTREACSLPCMLVFVSLDDFLIIQHAKWSCADMMPGGDEMELTCLIVEMHHAAGALPGCVACSTQTDLVEQ